MTTKQTRLYLGLFILLCANTLLGQVPVMERLGASDGLSQGMIYDLLQDRQGFLWFATRDGLNRYDGYSFQAFQNSPFDPYSISDNEVQCLLEDHLGRIWSGTANNGLNVMDPQTGKFFHLNNLSSQNIYSLAETSDGLIWAGTKNGLNRLRVPDQLPPYSSDLSSIVAVDTLHWEKASAEIHFPLNIPMDLLGSPDGHLWISSLNGFGYYSSSTGQFQRVWSSSPSTNGDKVGSYFSKGPNGSVWVGQVGRIFRIRDNNMVSFQLPETSVAPYTDIVFDVHGNLYVSTRKQIYKLPAAQIALPGQAKFQLLHRFPVDGIIGSTKMLVDKSGLLWIGTNGYGLLKYNPGNPHFHRFLPGLSPRRIYVDLQNRVWVRHVGARFQRLDPGSGNFAESLFPDDRYYQHDCCSTPDGDIWLLCEKRTFGVTREGEGILFRLNGQTLKQEAKYSVPIHIALYSRLHPDGRGNLWLSGCQSDLARFDLQKGTFQTFEFASVTGARESALSLDTDVRGHLLIGTPHGFMQGVPQGEGLKFILHKNNPVDPYSLGCNYILSYLNDPTAPDRYGWLGTKGGGVDRMDKYSGRFEHFTTANGLPNNVVYGILPGPDSTLWLSTNCGLSHFNPQTRHFENYYSVDGLQDNEFNTLSFARAPDGQLFFGGVNGITSFYPSELKSVTNTPPVYITRLKINNQVIRVGEGVLEKAIEQTGFITLDYQQNQLTFEFSALDFSAPRMNQFRYRLHPIDQNWVESTTDHSATYANLAPGHYVFEVITGGSRGIWNGMPARLEVRILPPWWRTGWAYLLYGLLLILGIGTYYRFQINKIRLENKLRYEQREAQRLVELDRLKTHFFSSITHEFRTPLTLVIEPVRQLISECKDAVQHYRLELVEQNAKRLLQFVNQLLDLSKLEAGQMPLDVRPCQPAMIVQILADQFQPLADQRQVQLKVELPKQDQTVLLDALKWEQVLTNLISNALKFTDKGGCVQIRLEQTTPDGTDLVHLKLSVSDTGNGIPAEALPRIFDRFFQGPAPAQGGTGIGLALCKELTEHMGGQIRAENVPGAGARFVVDLDARIALVPAQKPTPALVQVLESTLQPPTRSVEVDTSSTKPLILLVEDDAGLRGFIRASLPDAYRVAEATNGDEGIRMAQEWVPDLVISDVVMPNKNGFELASALKNDVGTSHIPILLLSAKSALESKIAGLRHGADAYLSKPFRADELIAHIEGLLTSRKRLQAYFAQFTQENSLSESASTAFSVQENEFLHRLIQIIEENLDNDEMDADAFSRAVFLSRSQLHRKISGLTGLSLTEFVRNYRLDRAREMLAQHNGNIAEVAWRTGFPNAKYFSSCFRARFGQTPSTFLAELHDKSLNP